MSESLEEEFSALVNSHKAEIDAKVGEASAALREAVKLSEKYGIPFRPHVSFLSNSYYPQSFYDKYSEIDTDTVSDLTGAWPGEYNEGEAGWEHSAVC